jgi:hypothetical protein
MLFIILKEKVSKNSERNSFLMMDLTVNLKQFILLLFHIDSDKSSVGDFLCQLFTERSFGKLYVNILAYTTRDRQLQLSKQLHS